MSDGLLVLNKPSGITARAVVDRAEQWFPGVRIGHAGTLDPLASGVLVLCLGRATRLIEYIQQLPKTYVVGIRLGALSNTDDADGEIQPVENPHVPTEEEVRQVLHDFVGEIEQVPPAHSAARVQGRRAYHLARKGHAVQLQPRRVSIYRVDVIRYAFPRLDLVVDCGKGTYIRSLARDVGQRLGCGGLVEALQRTRIGPFQLHEALDINTDPEVARPRLLPLQAAVAGLPSIRVSATALRRLRQGQKVPLRLADCSPSSAEVAVFDAQGELAAIATWQAEPGVLRPRKVLSCESQKD